MQEKKRTEAIQWAMRKAADDLVRMQEKVGDYTDFDNCDPFYSALETRLNIIVTGQMILRTMVKEDGPKK